MSERADTSQEPTARVVPRVGVSRCLLGERVRYDGGHKRNAFVVEDLAGVVELIPVCPEVEMGMPVPREPIHLVRGRADRSALRLVGRESGTDYTARARRHAEARVRDLVESGLSGFVLKSRSPSCGLSTTPIAVEPEDATGTGIDTGATGGDPETVEIGSGMFAHVLRKALPGIPIVDETTLADPCARHAFLVEVATHARLRAESPES